LRRWLALTLITLAALAILVGALVLTPLGHAPAKRLVEDLVADSAGYELSIGTLSGNLLSRIVLTDVRLVSAGGVPLVRAGSVVVDYELLPLLSGTISVPLLSVDDAETRFIVSREGRLLGWSDGASDTTSPSDTGRAWTIDAHVRISDLHVVYADSAAGLSVDGDIERLSMDGGPDAFTAVLEGRAVYGGPPLKAPLDTRIALDGAYSDRAVTVTSLSLRSDAATMEASGSLDFPASGATLAADVSSSFTVDAVAALLGADVSGGRAELTGSTSGPMGDLVYEASLTADAVLAAGIPMERMTAHVRGTGADLELSSFRGVVLGGSVLAEGTADLAATDGPMMTLEAEGAGVSLGMLEGASLEGVASFQVSGAFDVGRPTAAAGSLAVDVAGFGVGGRLYGDAAARASARDGALRASAVCCSTAIVASARLAGGGIDSLQASAEVRDLSVPAAVFGDSLLAGRASLVVEGDPLLEDPLSFEAVLPELVYGGTALGPARVGGVARGNLYEVAWSVLDETVLGDARFDGEAGAYELSARVVGLDLERVVPESLLEARGLQAAVSLSASVRGTFDGDFEGSGEVTDLAASVHGEPLGLVSPFSLRATPELVVVEPARVTGSFGTIGAQGTVTRSDSLDVLIDLERADLAVLERMVRGPVGRPVVDGLVTGRLAVTGAARAPVATLSISADSLNAAGVSFNEARIEADVDTTMVVFSLGAATTEGGALLANGLVPVRPDTATFLTLDRTREFALSLSAEAFSADLGELLLTGSRGPKRLTLDGSLLVTGLVDSLSSVNGRGDLRQLGMSFAPARVALADTLSFEIDAGDIWIENLVLDVTRTRVLSASDGGRVVVSGFVGVRDSVDVTARVDSLDVGALLRVIDPGPTAPLGGRLDLVSTIRGRLTAPAIEARWTMTKPTIAGFGFESFEGRVHAEGERVVVDHATLRTREDSLVVTGEVGQATGRTGEPGPVGRSLALSVRSGGIDLGGVRPLPPGVDDVDGVLTADVSISGTTQLPRFDGTVTLEEGLFRGFGMQNPARDMSVEVAALGRTFSMSGAEASLGSGRVTLDGHYDLDGKSGFLVKARLLSPEIHLTDVLDARLSGKLTWAGDADRSALTGSVVIEEANVIYEISLSDLAARRVRRVSVPASEDPRSRISLDLEVDAAGGINVDTNLAKVDLTGGVRVAGTLLQPRPTGSLFAESGTFKYLGTEFSLSTLSVSWRDPRRSDPYVVLVAAADVESRSGDLYSVTVRFDDYWLDGTFRFESAPPLSEPDIVALLTFGDTVGGFVSGGDAPGTSRNSFSEIARKAFVGSVFGVAESKLEDILDLDVVAIDQDTAEEGALVEGTGVTVGKRFGRVSISYTTAVGRFEEREVEVSFFLSKYLSLVTKADPGGNHAARIKLHIPIE
jgi:autotransporter translocation and assembly factor TamB